MLKSSDLTSVRAAVACVDIMLTTPTANNMVHFIDDRFIRHSSEESRVLRIEHAIAILAEARRITSTAHTILRQKLE
jgi:hypothetical protein